MMGVCDDSGVGCGGGKGGGGGGEGCWGWEGGLVEPEVRGGGG